MLNNDTKIEMIRVRDEIIKELEIELDEQGDEIFKLQEELNFQEEQYIEIVKYYIEQNNKLVVEKNYYKEISENIDKSYNDLKKNTIIDSLGNEYALLGDNDA